MDSLGRVHADCYRTVLRRKGDEMMRTESVRPSPYLCIREPGERGNLCTSLRSRGSVLRRRPTRSTEIHLVNIGGVPAAQELPGIQVPEECVHVQRANRELKCTELQAMGECQHLESAHVSARASRVRQATHESEFQKRDQCGPEPGVHCADDETGYEVSGSHELRVSFLQQ